MDFFHGVKNSGLQLQESGNECSDGEWGGLPSGQAEEMDNWIYFDFGGQQCAVYPNAIRMQGGRTHLDFCSDRGIPIIV